MIWISFGAPALGNVRNRVVAMIKSAEVFSKRASEFRIRQHALYVHRRLRFQPPVNGDGRDTHHSSYGALRCAGCAHRMGKRLDQKRTREKPPALSHAAPCASLATTAARIVSSSGLTPSPLANQPTEMPSVSASAWSVFSSGLSRSPASIRATCRAVSPESSDSFRWLRPDRSRAQARRLESVRMGEYVYTREYQHAQC